MRRRNNHTTANNTTMNREGVVSASGSPSNTRDHYNHTTATTLHYEEPLEDTTTITSTNPPHHNLNSNSNHRHSTSGGRERQVALRHPDDCSVRWSEFTCRLADKLPYFISHLFFPATSDADWTELQTFRASYVVPYDGSKEKHLQLLRQLWEGHHKIIFQPQPFAPVHADWKGMGFQADDPSTDFRDAGLLSLRQLNYFCRRCPELWGRMAAAVASEDFLLAAAGINVTMRLITLLGLNQSKNVLNVQHLPTYSSASARAKLSHALNTGTLQPSHRAPKNTANSSDESINGGGGVDPSVVQYSHTSVLEESSDATAAINDHTPPPTKEEEEEMRVESMEQRLGEVYCGYMTLLFKFWNKSPKNLMAFNDVLNDTYKEAQILLHASRSIPEFNQLVRESP